MEQLFFHSLYPGIVMEMSLARQERSEHHSFISPTEHPFSHLRPPLPFSLQLVTHLPLKEFVKPFPQLTKRVLEASVV